jgi:hypothetical protein
MTENTNTPFEKRCEILADLWLNYRDDQNFTEFIEYCDLALPLAYSISSNIIKADLNNERLIEFIDEAWELLLQGFKVEDTGFDNLGEIFSIEN